MIKKYKIIYLYNKQVFKEECEARNVDKFVSDLVKKEIEIISVIAMPNDD